MALRGVALACWVAIFLGLALPFLGLRAPRLPWQQLVRQPGFVACLALNASLLFRLVLYADMLLWPDAGTRSGGWWGFLGMLVNPNQNALPVVAAWVTFAARRPLEKMCGRSGWDLHM